MIRFLILFFFFLCGMALAVLVFSGCEVVPVDPDTDADSDADAGDGGMEGYDCAAACANLARLGCPGAEGSPGLDEEYGTPDDVPCEAVCVDVEANGVSMHTACTAAAGSCEAADGCFSR